MAELNREAIMSRARELQTHAADLCARAQSARQAAVEQRERARQARARRQTITAR
ncbi:hypothetical protein [Paractinoplanes brasiliensis]|uniref:Uncharacterized protein n=1 Tax=Paractinoplanes brasiliensis TaxID=52695 RepID=A0A4R6JC65_9ACTN|nr:hypothetical protein [Actinoplanes brasiliensis]TDO32907.1 hypothetical protein C8E87_8385 [Actinoplanes brasiliensis]GID28623.1 hypothetical protein Abr02nite_36060 [Actinoplanes brasiliensis]